MGSDSKITMFSTQKVTLGQIRWLERNGQLLSRHLQRKFAQEVWIDDDDELFSEDGEKCEPWL
jgi:hypothetical protein